MIILQQSLGIDIRDETLRLVLLGKTLKGIVLVDYLIKEYPGFMEKTRESEILDNLVAEFKSFLAENSKPNDVILGLPRRKVILRQLTLPVLDKEELADIITYEIEKHIPLPSEEIYFDYRAIEKLSDSEQKIELAIIKKEDLDFYLTLLERTGIAPNLATPLCYAPKDCPDCNHLKDQDMALLVDLGDKEIDLDLMRGNRLLFSRNLPIKGKGFDELFRVSKKQLAAEDKEESVTDPYTISLGTGLICEARNWLRNIQSVDEPELQKIILTGKNSYNLNLSDYFHEKLGIAVDIPNPFQGITNKKIAGKKASALAMATGLAVKGLKEKFTDLNLLPEELRVSRRSNALTFTLVFVILVIICLTATTYTGLGINNELYLPKRIRLEKIVNTSTAMQDEVKQVKELTKKIEEMSRDVEEIENLFNSRVSKLEVLKELSVIIPVDAWLDRANIDNANIELNGYADTSSTLIGLLEDSPLFENVIFPSTITKRAGREKERFRLKADIQRGLKE